MKLETLNYKFPATFFAARLSLSCTSSSTTPKESSLPEMKPFNNDQLFALQCSLDSLYSASLVLLIASRSTTGLDPTIA